MCKVFLIGSLNAILFKSCIWNTCIMAVRRGGMGAEFTRKAAGGCCSWCLMSPTVTNLQQPSCDDSPLWGYQMSLTSQLPLVTNTSPESLLGEHIGVISKSPRKGIFNYTALGFRSQETVKVLLGLGWETTSPFATLSNCHLLLNTRSVFFVLPFTPSLSLISTISLSISNLLLRQP